MESSLPFPFHLKLVLTFQHAFHDRSSFCNYYFPVAWDVNQVKVERDKILAKFLIAYVSDMKPQNQFLGLFSDACFLARSTTGGVVAAPINDVFSRHVTPRQLMRHLDHALARPPTHTVNFRSQYVFADSLHNRR